MFVVSINPKFFFLIYNSVSELFIIGILSIKKNVHSDKKIKQLFNKQILPYFKNKNKINLFYNKKHIKKYNYNLLNI